QQVARSPVEETLRGHWKEVLLAAGTRISENSCFYLFSTYIIAYAQDVLRVEPELALRAVNLAAALEFFTIPLFGLLSDRWSRKALSPLGGLSPPASSCPYHPRRDPRRPAWIVAAVVLSLPVGHAILYSVQASLTPELFGTRLRYTGASIGYQLAS